MSTPAQVSAWSKLIVAAFLLLSVAVRLGLAVQLDGRELVWILALAPVAWMTADLASGIVHWALDSYGDPDTPVLGPRLIAPFRRHHHLPREILERTGVQAIDDPSVAALPVLTLCLVATVLGAPPVPVAFVTIAITGLVFANVFHRWAHDPNPPRYARLLQRLGVALHPKEHARHHLRPNDRAYCITCGWLNPVLERVQLFERLERLLARCGVEVHGSTGRL